MEEKIKKISNVSHNINNNCTYFEVEVTNLGVLCALCIVPETFQPATVEIFTMRNSVVFNIVAKILEGFVRVIFFVIFMFPNSDQPV